LLYHSNINFVIFFTHSKVHASFTCVHSRYQTHQNITTLYNFALTVIRNKIKINEKYYKYEDCVPLGYHTASYCITGQSTYGILQDCVPLGYHTASLGNRLMAFYRTVYLWDIILHHWVIDLWHFTGLCTSGISYCIMLHHWAIDLWHFTGLCTSGISYCIILHHWAIDLWHFTGLCTFGISYCIILHHWAIDLWHFTGLCTSGISYCIIGQSTYGILQDSVPLGYHTASLGNWLMAFYRTMYLWDIILHHWAIDLWHFTRFNYPVMQHCVTEDQTSQTHYCGNLHFKLDWKIPLAYISGFLYYIYHKVMFLHLPCVGANLFVTTYSIHKTYQLT